MVRGEPSEVRHGASRGVVLLAISLGFAVVTLDVSVVNVALKSIGTSLGGGVSALQWVVSAYTVAFAALILTAGALADRAGARRVFVRGFIVFSLASIVCGLAPSLGVLIGARGVEGVGAAILVPASLTLLNHTYRAPAARARAVGLYLAGASSALAGGPLVGGLLIESLGWRAIFFINVPLAAIGVVATLWFATETPRAHDRGVDLPGQAAAVLTLLALVGATIESGRVGPGNPVVLIGFALALAAAAAFVGIERYSPAPMLPLRLFRGRAFAASTAIGLLVNTSFYGLIFVLSLLFQREQHLSPVRTGLALLPMTIAITAANLLAQRLTQRLGPRAAATLGAVLVGLGTAGLLGVGQSTAYASIVAQISLLGFGTGLTVAVITDQTLGGVERSRSGVAGGTLNTTRQAGSSIGVAVFGTLVATHFIAGAHVALAISTALMLVVVVLARFLGPSQASPRPVHPRKQRRSRTGDHDGIPCRV
jgi:MFS transporter, DHA2 family, methylenomycin A resistance protein